MKILLVDTSFHKKNLHGLALLNSLGGTEVHVAQSWEDYKKEVDLVISPVTLVNPFSFTQAKAILYGPHAFVFANHFWRKEAGFAFPPHAFYNCLSEWNKEVQAEVGGLSLSSVCLPFPVDVTKFSPSSQTKTVDCFLYSKHRSQEDLALVQKTLLESGLSFKVISYGSYSEEEYVETLRSCKFGVWLGCHESQGFAVQEALSCNVPLLVLNAKSMLDEHTKENKKVYAEFEGKYKLAATSVPYWNETCGRIVKDLDNLKYELIQMKIQCGMYNPRNYILETLSPEACLRRLEDFVRTKGRSI